MITQVIVHVGDQDVESHSLKNWDSLLFRQSQSRREKERTIECPLRFLSFAPLLSLSREHGRMHPQNALGRKYFGQNGEDFLVWSLFSGDEPGFFVDVGSFDGIHLSNSYSFELAGWDGICVEAHPEYFPHLQKNRPRSRTVWSACVEPGASSEIEFLTEPLGLLSGIEADKTLGIEKRYSARNMIFPGWQKAKVPAATLTSILEEANAPRVISFCTLDTEGTELNVLAGIDFDRFAFRLILAEANTREEALKMENIMRVRGYLLARRLNQNYFFVRSEEDAAILRACAGSFSIEDTIHPLGEQATRSETRGREISFASIANNLPSSS